MSQSAKLLLRVDDIVSAKRKSRLDTTGTIASLHHSANTSGIRCEQDQKKAVVVDRYRRWVERARARCPRCKGFTSRHQTRQQPKKRHTQVTTRFLCLCRSRLHANFFSQQQRTASLLAILISLRSDLLELPAVKRHEPVGDRPRKQILDGRRRRRLRHGDAELGRWMEEDDKL